MRLFDFFKKKEIELTDEQKKLNKIWDLWEEGKVASPYAELMTYQSQINNGGHDQYFVNIENTGNIEKEMSVLKPILPKLLIDNLEKAYQSYLLLEDNDDDKIEEVMEQCDDLFYENEEIINEILEEYAKKL